VLCDLAEAGGIEPPNGGIKIRWLFNDFNGMEKCQIAWPLFSNKEAAPAVAALGGGEGRPASRSSASVADWAIRRRRGRHERWRLPFSYRPASHAGRRAGLKFLVAARLTDIGGLHLPRQAADLAVRQAEAGD